MAKKQCKDCEFCDKIPASSIYVCTEPTQTEKNVWKETNPQWPPCEAFEEKFKDIAFYKAERLG